MNDHRTVLSKVTALLDHVPTVHVVKTNTWDGGFELTVTLHSWESIAILAHCAEVADTTFHVNEVPSHRPLPGTVDVPAGSILYSLGRRRGVDVAERLSLIGRLLVDELHRNGHLGNESALEWRNSLGARPSEWIDAWELLPRLVDVVERVPTLRVVDGTFARVSGFALAVTVESWTSLTLIRRCAADVNIAVRTRAVHPISSEASRAVAARRLVHTLEERARDADVVNDKLWWLLISFAHRLHDEGYLTGSAWDEVEAFLDQE